MAILSYVVHVICCFVADIPVAMLSCVVHVICCFVADIPSGYVVVCSRDMLFLDRHSEWLYCRMLFM